MIKISTDPYNRIDLMRDLVRVADRTRCKWCDSTARFRFGWARHDTTVVNWEVGQFCSSSCFREYTMK